MFVRSSPMAILATSSAPWRNCCSKNASRARLFAGALIYAATAKANRELKRCGGPLSGIGKHSLMPSPVDNTCAAGVFQAGT